MVPQIRHRSLLKNGVLLRSSLGFIPKLVPSIRTGVTVSNLREADKSQALPE